jgi:integrase
VVRAFKALLIKGGLPDIRFHDLRHSAASLLIAQGVPLRTVIEVLGHSTITLTANTYAHLFSEAKRDAASAMDRAFA